MKLWNLWLRACRPRTWIAVLSPIAIGGASVAGDIHSFDWITFAAILLAGLGIQIGTNLANDYFDGKRGSDTKERRGPVRVTQQGLVSLRAMRTAIAIAFSIPALLALILAFTTPMGVAILILAAISIALGILYTAGPFSLSHLGIADPFALLFFGPVASGTTAALLTGIWSWDGWLIGIGSGLFSVAILTANNLRDIDEDRKTEKKTLSVRWGRRFGQIEYTTAVVGAPFAMLGMGIYSPLLLVPFIVRSLRTAFEVPTPTSLLPKTGALLWIYTFLSVAELLL
jgi:1,4-dihydroxy-2-naphthoate octaprenyltransferase